MTNFFRRFSLFLPEGRIRTVTQMQMIVWPDLEAPKDARYESILEGQLSQLNLMYLIQATGGYGSEGRVAAGKNSKLCRYKSAIVKLTRFN